MHIAITESDTQRVGDFLDWLLNVERYTICTINLATDEYEPVHFTVQEWLAERHDIDLRKVEAERETLLQFVRLQNLVTSLEPKRNGDSN